MEPAATPDPTRSSPAEPPPIERRLRERRLRGARRAWDAFYGGLRWVAAHAHGVYSAYAAVLSIAFVGAAALAAFVGIAKVVLEGPMQATDEQVLRVVAAHRTALLTRAALQATQLGSGIVLVVLVLVASTFLWLTRHRHSTYLLLASFFGAWVLNTGLKDIFERPRPIIVSHLAAVSTASFPSGHAMTSMAAYGAIALLLTRLERTRPARLATWLLAALVILTIGASRIYLGVHYASDILGGYAAGLAWVAFAAAGMTALQFFGRRAPEIHEQERNLEGPTGA